MNNGKDSGPSKEEWVENAVLAVWNEVGDDNAIFIVCLVYTSSFYSAGGIEAGYHASSECEQYVEKL